MASSCLWLQTFRLAVPCRHSTGWTGGPQRAAILGRRGLEPQFSDSVASIYLYATRPRVGAGLSRLSEVFLTCIAPPTPQGALWWYRQGSNLRRLTLPGTPGALPTELRYRVGVLLPRGADRVVRPYKGKSGPNCAGDTGAIAVACPAQPFLRKGLSLERRFLCGTEEGRYRPPHDDYAIRVNNLFKLFFRNFIHPVTTGNFRRKSRSGTGNGG